MAQYFVLFLFGVVAAIIALIQTDYFGEHKRRAGFFAIGLTILTIVGMFVFIPKEDWRNYLLGAIEKKKDKGNPSEGYVRVPKEDGGDGGAQGGGRPNDKDASSGGGGMGGGSGGGSRILSDDAGSGGSKKPQEAQAAGGAGNGGRAKSGSGSLNMPVDWNVISNSGRRVKRDSQKKFERLALVKKHASKGQFNNHVIKSRSGGVPFKQVGFAPIYFDNGPAGPGGRSTAGGTSTAGVTSGDDKGSMEDTGERNKPQGDTLHSSQCKYCPRMVVIPLGDYLMGSPEDEPGHDFSEAPMVRVTISKPFAIGMFEVTKIEFNQFMIETGHQKQGQCKQKPKGFSLAGWFEKKDLLPPEEYRLPADCLSWWDANAYVDWLSEKTGMSYRLPSAAEWEYAARAMTKTAYHTGEEIDGSQAQFYRSQRAEPSPVEVTTFKPNRFGLYNMHGNIAEWVDDCWHTNLYEAPSHQDAWTQRGDCKYRVTKGGSWLDGLYDIRAAARGRQNAELGDKRLGLRVVRDLY